MAKKILKNSILVLLFFGILFLGLGRLSSILRLKTYSGVQDRFAVLERDSIDTVFIGNSHQFCSMSPEILYDEYGMETFMLATSAQTVPMSYYAAMEAIELQHPSTIVFEVAYCANDFRTVTDEMSHCFFDGMPKCRARKLALDDLIEEGRIYYDFPIGLYHTRWKELSEEDFTNHMNVTDRGGVYYEEVVRSESIPLIEIDEREPMPEEMEKYMDLLVALCEENQVELILYTAPFNTLYGGDEGLVQDLYRRERIFNYIYDYAAENGLEYHNLFYETEEIGLDNDTDWMDRQHLNCYGQEKFTRYMVEKGYIR